MESYFARALQGDLPLSSIHGTEDNLPRLLEILDIICGEDGEIYALQLKNVLRAAEGEGPPNKRPVLQEAVEEMLTRIHSGKIHSWDLLRVVLNFLFFSQPTVLGVVDASVFSSALLPTRTMTLAPH